MAKAPVIELNLQSTRERIAAACRRAGRDPADVRLVAVTKTVSPEEIGILYDMGQRDFGENRPQSLWKKAPELPSDIRWHLIGSLQTNKVRRTLPLVASIDSVDRLELAKAISEESRRLGRPVRVALEVNVTGEQSKHGFSAEQLRECYRELIGMEGLDVIGLMTMARFEEDPQRCRPTFAAVRELRDSLRREVPEGPELAVLSMGMSGDFEVAIEEGATEVRIGSALFEGLIE